MKSKNIKVPFCWEERAPVFDSGILFVPKYYQDHSKWVDLDRLQDFIHTFSDIRIEYCSGTGMWIAEKARQNPAVLWIAVEKRFDRVRKILDKKEKFSLENLLIVYGEALTFTKNYLSTGILSSVFVNFPDPWPKDRHAKHRLIQESFVKEIARTTKVGGSAVFVTDDETYSEQMMTEMMREKFWTASFPKPYYITEWPSYGSSYFEGLWKEQGRNIRYIKFNRSEELWRN